MTVTIISKHGIAIRLPDERWAHIIEEHGELAEMQSDMVETVANPERILVGNAGERLAMRTVEPGKWLVVVYRELENDGFIITAFLTRRTSWLKNKVQLWP